MAGGTRVLLVDDDAGLLRTVQLLLEDEGGYTVETAVSGEAALERLHRAAGFRAVLTDLSMPGMDGLELMRHVAEQYPGLPVILMTAFGSVRSAVEAMKSGAFTYLTKPVDPDELLLQVRRAVELARLAGEHRGLRERAGDPERFDELVGASAAMERLRAQVVRVAAVDSTVLLRGETGTGKELAARSIHRASPRASQRFVTINCTAIPGELIESELFGHEKGAFTGAAAARAGCIDEAAGGTLFLDEIGDMPPALQPKLLRFLQERTYRRVGGGAERTADVRVIAATHRDLERAMGDGSFRADLFHRLDTLPIELPPLRERLEDMPDLARHLAAKIARRIGLPPVATAPDALAALAAYAFPGNVRELENVLERALVLGRAAERVPPEIRAADLALGRHGAHEGRTVLPLDGGLAHLERMSEELERDVIVRALAAWPGVPNAEIAERLGTNRRVLELRMKRHGLEKGR